MSEVNMTLRRFLAHALSEDSPVDRTVRELRLQVADLR